MAPRSTLRSVAAAGVLAFVLVAAGCSASNDPDTWAEAEEDGNLEENFLRACTEAGGGGDLDEAEAADYCRCAFGELVEYYGGGIDDEGRLVDDVATAAAGRDFEAFKAQESDLRSDPEVVPADIRAMFEGCLADSQS